MHYPALDAAHIHQTVQTLAQRISERFNESELHQISLQLEEIAEHAKSRTEQISSPITWVRMINVLLIVLVITGIFGTFYAIEFPDQKFSFFELIQIIETGINDVVFIGAAIFFLVSIETRIKRVRALKAMHELRLIAHAIDMTQLTKDPERILKRGEATASSPQERMSPFELSRYLDYCSELLSLTGKIAALYVRDFDDSVTLTSVNEIESLTTGLSRKIWQKLMIVHSLRDEFEGVRA